MNKTIMFFLAIVTSLIGQPRELNFVGGPHHRDGSIELKCISEQERLFVRENRIEVDHGSARDTILFQDPIGNGGMVNINDSVRHHIFNYVDQNVNVGWIQDYNCNYVTYDGHQGTDMGICGFYYMDEMNTPILAAAPGIVSYSHDGEFDRHLYWQTGAIANGVIVSHSDGTSAWYWHMKKNTVAVAVGDTVETGDTLGFVGSSGVSSGPHLHFEVEGVSGNFKDPWEGQCGDGPSLWDDQLPFIGDTSVYDHELLFHLTTSYPINGSQDVLDYVFSENLPDIKHINPGEFFLSGGWIRNLYDTDTLKQKFYRNGELVDEFSWVPGNTYYWYQGFEVYTASFWYSWGYWGEDEDALGDWTEEIYINSDLLAVKNFVCDEIPNQDPSVDFQQISVELGETVTGEFTATDDGDPFWFNLESEPNNGGTIELHGGRKRKFEYTAPLDFNGLDVIGVSATDDRGETGAMTFIIFEVSGSGLMNMMVEPSYVAPLQDSVLISAEIVGDVDQPIINAFIKDMNNGEEVEVELEENNGSWSAYWVPGSESYFNVDLQMINNTDDDTLYYEDVQSFTSVGPLTVSMVGEATTYPDGNVIMEFVVQNHSLSHNVSDVSVSFEPAHMSCIDNFSQELYNLGDIAPGDSIGSGGYFFVATLNNECNADSTILINVHIYTGENDYWEDNFSINIETLGITGSTIPTEYILNEAFPNPFNPQTTIKYALPKKGFVTLAIYDLMGRKVKTLISSKKEAGFRSVHWDATNDKGESVSAGMYFYTIESDKFRDTKKMIFLK